MARSTRPFITALAVVACFQLPAWASHPDVARSPSNRERAAAASVTESERLIVREARVGSLTPRTFIENDARLTDATNRTNGYDLLSQKEGFATGYTVHFYPQRILDTDTYAWEFVQIDMNNDGTFERQHLAENFPDGTPVSFNYPVPGTGTTGSADIFVRVYGAGIWSEVLLPVTLVPATNISFESAEGDRLTGYKSDDGYLNRPLVIVEGIDNSNTTWPPYFLAKLQEAYRYLQETLGYDVLVYNYADGAEGVRDNAMGLLGALLELEEENLPFPTRVLGISMGGVIARYALAWAEENDYDHGCDMFISADAPQQGAWLSVDLQELIRDFDEAYDDETLDLFVDHFSKPSSMDLLRVNVYDPCYPNASCDMTGGPIGNEISGTSNYVTFYNELNALNGDGYPHTTINLGLSNGAGDIPTKYLQACAPDNGVGGTAFLKLKINDLPYMEAVMVEQDVYAASYQPAYRQDIITGNVFRFTLPFVGELFRVDYDIILTGAETSFVWANSALDLWGIERDVSGEIGDVFDWEYTKFDEIYINPATFGTWPSPDNAFHDEFTSDLTTVTLDRLAADPCEQLLTFPAGGQLLHNGHPITLLAETSGACVDSYTFWVSRNGGTSWTEIGTAAAGGPSGNDPTQVSLDWMVDVEPSDNCLVAVSGASGGWDTSDRPLYVVDEDGPNARGVLVAHVNEELVYSLGANYCGQSGISSCSEVDVSRTTDSYEESVVFLFAAFPAAPRLSGVSFAVDYSENGDFGITHHGKCADFEVTMSGWPNPGKGTSLTWNSPRTDPFVEIYWFVVDSGVGGGHLDFRRHPTQGGYFADDSTPTKLDPIVEYGRLGFWVLFNQESPQDVPQMLPCPVISDAPEVLSSVPQETLHCVSNPFSTETTFRREGIRDISWIVEVFDTSGSRVFVSEPILGDTWSWNGAAGGRSLPGGVYFARLADSNAEAVKVVLSR